MLILPAKEGPKPNAVFLLEDHVHQYLLHYNRYFEN